MTDYLYELAEEVGVAGIIAAENWETVLLVIV
jgi:hypothetical protein